MKNLLADIKINVNKEIFLKDPESSELGLKIIRESIALIDDLGFECFTIRKLAAYIKSTEASVYRYFESKHKLLLYLTSWYWAWTEYKIVFGLANIESPSKRLEKAITILLENIEEDQHFEHISEVKLHKIVISESSKVYHTHQVDEENKQGVFLGYKRLVNRISDIIIEINPDFKYPHMLISTMLEGANNQRYFAEHLPNLTDTVEGEDAIVSFYTKMVFRTIEKS